MSYRFQKLKDYFDNQRDDRIVLTFEQIEKINGRKLCKSAYNRNEYWQHKSSPTHRITLAWVEAGYEVENLSQRKEHKMTFIRTKKQKRPKKA